jgi:multidrug efflux pump subunit AcrA (membrane-fusion protein)
MSVHISAAAPISPSSLPRPKSSTRMNWGVALGAILAAGAMAAAANLTHDRLFHPKVALATGADTPAADPKLTHDLTTTVVLPEGKFAKAGIKVEPVQTIQMPREVAVTGRIEADPNRRVDIRPRASGVVRTVPALPGTKVKKGDTLVVLDSPDVGSARLKVREKQRELATVRVEAGWKAEIAANVRGMIDQFRKGLEARDLMKQFAGKTLGVSRGTLVAAFTELEIAAHEQEKQTDLSASRSRRMTGSRGRWSATPRRWSSTPPSGSGFWAWPRTSANSSPIPNGPRRCRRARRT